MLRISDILEWIAQSHSALVGFSVCIVLFALVSAFWYGRQVGKLRRELRALNALISAAAPDASRDSLHISLAKSVIADTYLGVRFAAYLDGLFPSLKSGPRYQSAASPDQALGIRDIASHEINLRFYQSVPNVLIGLGLFFTFLGLTAALMAATQGARAADVTVAQQALNRLLGAATFKFVTSLIGLAFSIAFGFFEKWQYKGLARAFNELHHTLAERFPHAMTENLLAAERQASSIKRAAKLSTIETIDVLNSYFEDPVALALIRQDIVRMREESEEQTALLKTFSTDLAVSISKAIDESLSPQLTATFGKIEETIQNIGHHLTTSNTEALSSIVHEFSNQFEAQAKASVTSMLSAIESLTGTIGEHSERFAASFESVQGVVEKLHIEGAKGLDTIVSLLQTFNASLAHLERISRQLRATALPISEAAENAGRIIQELGVAQGAAADMVARLPAIADGFEGIDRDLSAVFESIHGGLTRSLDDMRSFMTELDSSFSKSIGGVHEVTSSLTSGVDGLSAGLGDFSQAIEQLKVAAQQLEASRQSDLLVPALGNNVHHDEPK